MNLYEKFYPIAFALLTQLGVTATITRTTTAGGSKYRGGGTTTKTETISTQASLASEPVVDDQGRQVTATLATLLAEPRQGDQLTIETTNYIVGKVTVIAPQGQAIIYRAEVTA